MFGASKITILRLLADAGTLAQQWHDLTVRDLTTKRIQMDEIWSFVHTKQGNVQRENWFKGHGDQWTWVAMDADSKLVISWLVGGRDSGHANPFVSDVAERITDRVQITSDGWQPYRNAIERAFGTDVDYAMLIKEYAGVRDNAARYSPPVCIAARPVVQVGNPDEKHINTSYAERQNLTMRMQMRRFTRLTNGFSKKVENHQHAIALHYFHYNFIRKHQTIKTTPAVMSGVAQKAWTMLEFVELLENEERMLGGRLTDYKMAATVAKRKSENDPKWKI
jgi:IS1 family transposase